MMHFKEQGSFLSKWQYQKNLCTQLFTLYKLCELKAEPSYKNQVIERIFKRQLTAPLPHFQ